MPSARTLRLSPRTLAAALGVKSTALPDVAPWPLAASEEDERDAVEAIRPAVVVITGATSGVGRATAHAFARRGAHLGLIARGEDALYATVREVEALGGEALAFQADVADPEQVEAAAAAVEKKFGSIDVWINNAVTSVFAPVWRASPEEMKRVTEVTYLGAAYGAMAALKRMRPRNHGTIVMVGAALAYRGMPLQSAYCAAKHAMHGFTESLRCELMHEGSGVHLTTVHLPAVNTPQFDMARSRLPKRAQPVPPVFQPEVAADGILWAVTHHRRELFVGSSTTLLVWGNKFAPGWTDRYLARRGFDQQQSAERDDPRRLDNLFEPVPGDHGTHGSFEDVAHARSVHLWLTTHRGVIASAALVLLSIGAA
ncbi:MAG: SDR family oxidoreductase, partial [Polyangiaceae bacterium]|nr:SDR family oxidoreductase [Polyangiaceae bacterium]